MRTVRIGDIVQVEVVAPNEHGTEEAQTMVFQIVAPHEADCKQKLSCNAPIPQALLGRSCGDVITVEVPCGMATVRVLAVLAD